MFNKDLMNQKNAASVAKLMGALSADNADEASAALQEMQAGIADAIEQEFEQYKSISDMSVLQSRGLRALTSQETDWYQKFIGAVKAGTKQEITNIGSAIPVTVVDRVIEDMKKSHPLLDALNIIDAAGATKLITNATQLSAKLGSWGAVGSAISTEVKGAVKVADLTAAKYTAYFIIPKDFTRFNFGFAPMWVDNYIRIVLSEAIGYGLENTIINGDGKGQFIGMGMDLSATSGGKYSAKTAVKLTDLSDSYAAAIADNLAKDENGDPRMLTEVLLVVNPVDYIKTVRRYQNAVTSAGVLDLLSLAFPTSVVASAMVAEGTAKLGIAGNYFAAINGGKSGIIEMSDEAQFLEDNRVYTTRVYGFGTPIDNKSFINLDITGVEAPALPVKVKGAVTTKASA